MADAHEADGDLWKAARRTLCAASCVNFGCGIRSTAEDGVTETELLKRGCNLLMRADQTPDTRTLELQARGAITLRAPWSDPFNQQSVPRIEELVQAGVVVTSPTMRLALTWSQMGAHYADNGHIVGFEHNFNNPEATLRKINGCWFAKSLFIDEMVKIDDPYRMVTLALRFCPRVAFPTGFFPEGCRLMRKMAPHHLIVEAVNRYHSKHHEMVCAGPQGFDFHVLHGAPAFAAWAYSDTSVIRKSLLKWCDIYATLDIRTMPSLFIQATGSQTYTNSYLRWAGMSDVMLA